MTPNKPIGTAKVELPEFYTEEMLEARCHKAVAWHIRALQAYIQQPSPLVDENRRLKEKADDYERALKEIAQGRPADAKWCFNRARQALAQPETKGEG